MQRNKALNWLTSRILPDWNACPSLESIFDHPFICFKHICEDKLDGPNQAFKKSNIHHCHTASDKALASTETPNWTMLGRALNHKWYDKTHCRNFQYANALEKTQTHSEIAVNGKMNRSIVDGVILGDWKEPSDIQYLTFRNGQVLEAARPDYVISLSNE